MVSGRTVMLRRGRGFRLVSEDGFACFALTGFIALHEGIERGDETLGLIRRP